MKKLNLLVAALVSSAGVIVPNWIKGEKYSSKRGSSRIGHGNKGGKYMPHQGKREMARRVRQMERNAAKAAERHNAAMYAQMGYGPGYAGL